jgi:hypothetical protein
MSLKQIVNSWVPRAVIKGANRLHAEFSEQNSQEGLKVLSRLIFDKRMQAVWQLLTSKKRDEKYQSTDVFSYPAVTLRSRAENLRRQARELRKKGGESNEIGADSLESEANAAWNAHAKAEEVVPAFANYSASRAQDFALARLFDFACRAAIDIEPTYSSDVKAKMKRAAAVCSTLGKQQIELVEIGLYDEAGKLDDIIEACADLVDLQLDSILDGDPLIISRKRADPKIRTYVAQLAELSCELFGTPLHGTLATIANVAFDCETVTRAMVEDWLS